MTFQFLATMLIVAVSCQEAKEAAELQGEWVLVAIERNGKTIGGAGARKEQGQVEVIVEGNMISLKRGPNATRLGAFKLIPKKKPKAVDITTTAEFFAWTHMCAYELVNDTLRIAQPMTAGVRPKKLVTVVGSQHIVFVLERKKRSGR